MKKFLVIIFFLVSSLPLFAYDYVINDLNVNVEVGKNAVHSITEDYNVYFERYKHGIVRMIPIVYDQPDLKVRAKVYDLMCSDPYDTETEDGTFLIYIGDENVTVKGDKSYSLKYKYDLPEDINEGYDEFYFNLLGDGWDVPVNNFNFAVFIPVSEKDVKIWVTTGTYGSKNQVPFTVKSHNEGIIVTGSVSNIIPGGAVTIRAEFAEGWYENARKPWDYRKLAKIACYIISGLLIGVSATVFMKYGKSDPFIVTARFEPPKGFDPALVAQLVKNSFEQKDLSAMIFYWADAGYLKIIQVDKNTYNFKKLSDLPSSAPSHQITLFNGFFKNANSNGEVSIKNINSSSFYRAVDDFKSALKKFFTGERAIFDAKGSKKKSLVYFLSIFPMILGVLSLTASEWELSGTFGYVVLCLVFIIFYSSSNTNISSHPEKFSGAGVFIRRIIPVLIILGIFTAVKIDWEITSIKSVLAESASFYVGFIASSVMIMIGSLCVHLTDYGKSTKEHILGLKEFISKAEITQLKRMIDQNPEYYFHILSYAIVLGLEDKWAKKFSSIQIKQPSWYVSSYGLVNAYFYTNMLSQVTKHVSLSSSTISSGRGTSTVRGGGFGSSGFSGGGFGGGGGRSW